MRRQYSHWREILLSRAIYYTRKGAKSIKNGGHGAEIQTVCQLRANLMLAIGNDASEKAFFLAGFRAFQVAHIAAYACAVGGGETDVGFAVFQLG